jgi:hypothetical protein
MKVGIEHTRDTFWDPFRIIAGRELSVRGLAGRGRAGRRLADPPQVFQDRRRQSRQR